MYVEARERQLVRRAIDAMKALAVDELMSEEIDGMYPPNIDFIVASLKAMTNDMHQGTPAVTDHFNESEVRRLNEILTGIQAVYPESGTPRTILSDNVELSESEVAGLLEEESELKRKSSDIAVRLEEINQRIYISGESKYRNRSRPVPMSPGLRSSGVQIGDGNQQNNIFER